MLPPECFQPCQLHVAVITQLGLSGQEHDVVIPQRKGPHLLSHIAGFSSIATVGEP
jgi:hypothetical protein